MFCSQCGKKVRENMLFCPFCGAEIVIPEQDAPEPAESPEASAPGIPEEPRVEAAEEEVFSVADWRAEEPDWLKDEPEEEPEPPKPEPIPTPEPPAPRRPVLAAQQPPRVSGSALNRDVRASDSRHYGKADPSPINGGGLFMEEVRREKKRDDYDEYDALEDPYDSLEEDDDAQDVFEDEDRPGFLLRHLRSVVGVLLLLALIAVVALYAMSGQGQVSLAKANLAWRPEVYSSLGKASYEQGRYNEAGLYYERALSRAPGNYGYASSAAKCYLDGENNEKAAEMLIKCIGLRPEAEDPYVYLLGLYPDALSRPLEVTQLIEQGYRLTGSNRLKLE